MFSVRSLSLAVAIAAIAASGPTQAASINLGGNGGLLGTGLLGGGGDGGNKGSVNLTIGANAPGSNGGGAVSATVGDDGSGGGNVLLDLFGNGGNSGDAGLSLGVGLGDDGQGSTASADPGRGDVTFDLFGNGADNSADGAGGDGGSPNTAAAGLLGSGAAASIAPASLNSNPAKSCFTPNPRQLAQLVNRHDYVSGTFDTWAGASTVKVIDAGVCGQAAARIDAQDNIGRLQAHITADPQLRAQIAQWGHNPTDVIAVDRQGKTLIVYVS